MVEPSQIAGPDGPVRGMLLVLDLYNLRLLRPDHQLGVSLRRQIRQLCSEYGDGNRGVISDHDGIGTLWKEEEHFGRISAVRCCLCDAIFYL